MRLERRMSCEPHGRLPHLSMRIAQTLRKNFRIIRPKYLLFALVGLMMIGVIQLDRFRLDPRNSTWEHYHYFKWWLLPHGITGALALFLGPSQFSDRLRRRFLPWHRVLGRIYVGAVAVAAPLGIWIEYVKYR